MAITLYRVPSGWVNVLRNIVCAAIGNDSMGCSGSPVDPFATPAFIFNTFLEDARVQASSLNNMFMRILLGNPPEPATKSGQKKAWYINIAITDLNGSILSYKLLDISSNIKANNLNAAILSFIGTFYNLIINNGGWDCTGLTADAIDIIASVPSGSSAGSIIGLNIINSIFQNHAQNAIGATGLYYSTVMLKIVGDDCVISGVQFFSCYNPIGLYITGRAMRVENTVFSATTVAIVADRRLTTLWKLIFNSAPLVRATSTPAMIYSVLNIPRHIQNCYFESTDYVIDYEDYFIALEGTVINGSIVSVSASDLDQVVTDQGNYYPLAVNDLVGWVLVDEVTYAEYPITASDAFTGVYPFNITVNGNPQGTTFKIKAPSQGTFLIGNYYADQQVDSDGDGIADVAGTYPTKGFGLGKTLYPDPMPMMAQFLDIDRVATNPAANPGQIALMPDNKVLITTAVQNKLTTIVRGDTPQISFDLGFDCTGWTATFGAKVSPSDATLAIGPITCVWTNQALGQGYAQLASTDTAIAGKYQAEIQLTQGSSVQTPLKINLVVLTDVVQ